MSYGTTRYRRKRWTTKYRKRYSTGRNKPRYRRRRYSRRRGTVSSVVRLSQDATWTLRNQTTTLWSPFSFSPMSLPGFSDYQSTYSHFRILKARLYISRSLGADNDGSQNNYLVVGSRPFAATDANQGDDLSSNFGYLPAQTEEALRQTKWQRVHYPNTTTRRVSVGFYPYTMVGTYGPPVAGGSHAWYRIWEAKKWMPFNWAKKTSSAQDGLRFYGPYMVVDGPYGNVPGDVTYTVQCSLHLTLQFKGQR